MPAHLSVQVRTSLADWLARQACWLAGLAGRLGWPAWLPGLVARVLVGMAAWPCWLAWLAGCLGWLVW